MLRNAKGFTLIEIMITLIIVVILSSIGFISMSGYLPKQRLIASQNFLESILQRGQNEAYTRSSRVGVRFTPGASNVVLATVFVDANSDYIQNSGENELTHVSLRNDVSFTKSNCPGVNLGTVASCDYSTTLDCYVFFDGSGQAVDSTVGPAQGTPIDYELFLYSDKLENGTNTREVEVLGSGMVQAIKIAQAGNASGARCAASTPPLPAGCTTACSE